jgi:transglutaminase-like putative cysteine protease
LDLRTNLGSATDDPVLNYTGPATYIRLQTLDVFDAKSTTPWIPDSSVPPKTLPDDGTVATTVPGLTAGTQPKTNQVSITYLTDETTKLEGSNLSSLPLPYPAAQVKGLQAGFSVNPDSLAVLSASQVYKTMTYSATYFDTTSLLPSQLATATLPQGDDKTLFGLAKDLETAGIPADVTQLAKRITAGLTNPVDQAQAIQNYFQSSVNGYSYSIDVPSKETGAGAMEYLLQHKKGFCQFYAATMAAMARSLGIPARVAVGFTPGSSIAGDTYQVKTHDYHAWPELFFHNVGWLRFEPTVSINNALISGGHGRIPNYNTSASGTTTPQPSQSPTTTSAPGAGASSAANCPVNIRKAGGCADNSEAGGALTAPKSKFSWLGWFGAVPRFLQYWLFGGSGYAIALRFILLALLLIACVPMVLRIVRRRARWKLATGRRTGRRGSGTPDDDGLEWESADAPTGRRPEQDPERLRILAAWDELRDSATDLGYAWPSSETPRRSAERIIKQAHLSRPAQDAMGRVTVLAERANYAKTLRRPTASGAAPMPSLMDDVKEIRAGLAEPVSRRTRIRATVLPPSALAALRERREDFTGRVYERVQGAGSRLRTRTPGRGRGQGRTSDGGSRQ